MDTDYTFFSFQEKNVIGVRLILYAAIDTWLYEY